MSRRTMSGNLTSPSEFVEFWPVVAADWTLFDRLCWVGKINSLPVPPGEKLFESGESAWTGMLLAGGSCQPGELGEAGTVILDLLGWPLVRMFVIRCS